MRNLIYILIFTLLFPSSVFAKKEAETYDCRGNLVKTHMGDICVWPDNQKSIINSYMGVYINYLYKNFDVNKIPFSGRKYSNKRLYNVYKYIIHKDGSITDIKPVVLENSQFDEHVKNFILNYPPAPLIDGMPDEIKVELEVTQGISTENIGIVGYIWSEYYRIIFEKGVFCSDK